MGFLTKEGLQNLTNKLVQGDAIKVASHRGKNVKEVIDNIQRECENVATPNTMTLENRVNEFKIGQGRDVDVSGDVEEGKVEVELQGKTYQNLVEYIADYEGYEKNGFYYSKNTSRKLSFGLKPNTVYTRILDVKECFEPFWMYDSINNSDGTYRQYSYRIKQGLVINKFTSSDLGTINSYTFNPDQNVTNKENFNIVIGRMILLEGDYTQTPVEELPKYFEGIKSSFEDGVVDVEVTGKNLWSYENQLTFDVVSIPSIGLEQGVYKITSSNITGQKHNDSPYINFVDSKGDTISATSLEKGTVMINRDVDKIVLYSNGFDYVNSVGKFVTFGNFQLEKVPNKTFNPTPYEPYYKKKISFNIGEPLRSLPSGVCDEIRNNNGQWELIRRVGKVVLDGSDLITLLSSDSLAQNTMRFIYYPNPERKSGLENLICDRFKVKNIYSLDEEGVLGSSGSSAGYLRIEKSKLVTLDVAGLKQWLQANPTTIYYELATPIITPIEPISFDIKPLATMTINSHIAPTSIHTVELNRAGQIEQGIELIANLKSRINVLEDIYDSNLITTQYRIDYLKLNYELEREED